MKRNVVSVEIVTRESVEQLAEIIGENSAAAQALKASEQYPYPVFFRWRGALFVADKSSIEAVAAGSPT